MRLNVLRFAGRRRAAEASLVAYALAICRRPLLLLLRPPQLSWSCWPCQSEEVSVGVGGCVWVCVYVCVCRCGCGCVCALQLAQRGRLAGAGSVERVCVCVCVRHKGLYVCVSVCV